MHLCGASLRVLAMERISARRVNNFRRTAHAAFDQVAMEGAVLSNGDLMLLAVGLSSDRHVTHLRFLRDTRR